MSPPKTSVTASSNVMFGGLSAIASPCRSTAYSAWPPNLAPSMAMTSSPGLRPVTSAPTASTTPATSIPNTGCFGRRTPSPGAASSQRPRGTSRLRARWSAALTVLAHTRMRTSLRLTGGCGKLLHPNEVWATEPAVDRGPHLRTYLCGRWACGWSWRAPSQVVMDWGDGQEREPEVADLARQTVLRWLVGDRAVKQGGAVGLPGDAHAVEPAGPAVGGVPSRGSRTDPAPEQSARSSPPSPCPDRRPPVAGAVLGGTRRTVAVAVMSGHHHT